MHLNAVSLGLFIQLVFALGDIGTMNIFDYCSDGVNYVIVPNDTKLAVTLNGVDWPGDSYICRVVFKSSPAFPKLYYNFTSFRTNLSTFEIKIERKAMYALKDTFSLSNPPPIGKVVIADKYLKILLSRKEKQHTTISAQFVVFAEANKVKSGGLSKDNQAVIIGSVAGFLIAVGLCLLFIYLRCKYVAKRSATKENKIGEKGTTAVLAEAVPMCSNDTPILVTGDPGQGQSSSEAQLTDDATDRPYSVEDENTDKSTHKKLIQN